MRVGNKIKTPDTESAVICDIDDDGAVWAMWGDNNRKRYEPDQVEVTETYKWQMPEELEPYRQYICHTGGNEVERLMDLYNLQGEEGARLMRTNLPLYIAATMVGAQVDLLRYMNYRGAL